MADTKDELHGTVLGIVHELEAAASGSLYRDGGFMIIEDLDEWKKEQYGKKVEKFRKEHPEDSYDPEEYGFDTYQEWMEDEIGTADDIDEPDEVSLPEYVEEQSLGDVRFEIDSSKELCGGKVLFCYGGPNVWVADDEVRGYWGCDSCEMSLDSEARKALWGWFEGQWDALR